MSNSRRPSIRIRVSVLIRDRAGRLLMVRHRKDGREYLLLPGGGQRAYEPMEATARRELAEELRLDELGGLTFVGIRETMSEAAGRHLQFALFGAEPPDLSGIAVGSDPRVIGFAWCGADELPRETVYPAMTADLVAWAQGRPVPAFRQLPWID